MISANPHFLPWIHQCVVAVHLVELIVVFVAAIFSFHSVILDKAISATCTFIMSAAR